MDATGELESLTLDGKPVEDDGEYTICLQGYHYKNSADNLGLTNEELTGHGPPRVVTTSARDVLEEYLHANQHLNARLEGRLVYK